MNNIIILNVKNKDELLSLDTSNNSLIVECLDTGNIYGINQGRKNTDTNWALLNIPNLTIEVYEPDQRRWLYE